MTKHLDNHFPCEMNGWHNRKMMVGNKNMLGSLCDYGDLVILPMYSPFTKASNAWPKLATRSIGEMLFLNGKSPGLICKLPPHFIANRSASTCR